MRSQALRSAALRVLTLRLLLFLGFIVLAGRAAWLTVVMNTAGLERGDSQHSTHITLPPARGLILDRDDHELAVTTRAPSVYVFPKLLKEPESDLRALARVLRIAPAQLIDRVGAKRGFRYVARWIDEDVAIRVQSLELAGVGIEREPRRSYPSGRLAASLIGFANIDGTGVRGVEQMMDEWLKGAPQTIALERDARGRLLSSHTVNPRKTLGGDVRLTIDAGLQALAESALRRSIEKSGAKGGLVIAIDPRTGGIISLAEAPSFDPNHFRDVDFKTTRSRAFEDVVEPGSTFKAFLVAAALDAGAIQANQSFDTGDGHLRVPGKTIRDHDPYGVIEPTYILGRSSNVGAVLIAQALGPQRYFEALRDLGFGRSTRSGFPSESAGILRDWRNWKPVDHATVAFGQGVSVTGVQIASALATLANDGRRMRPHLVQARRAPLGEWEALPPVDLGQVISPHTAQTVLGMMQAVVGPHGTGRLAGLYNVAVAGKTGTSQKLDIDTGRYSQTRYIAWFMGVVPADDPRVAIVVALDEPTGAAHTGGAVAAPVFAQVATDQLAHLGIPTHPEPIRAEPDPILLAAARKREAARLAAEATAPSPAARVAKRMKSSEPTKALPPVAAAPAASAVTPAQRTIALLTAKPTRRDTPFRLGGKATTTTRGRGLIPRNRAVLVPDFRGSRMGGASVLAAREDLDLRVEGGPKGRVVSQHPLPGTILRGSERIIQLTLTASTGGTMP